MRKALGFAFAILALFGCTDYSEDIKRINDGYKAALAEARTLSEVPEERLQLIQTMPSYLAARAIRDSLLQLGPRIRYYNDSLAAVDSANYAYLSLLRVSSLYERTDTTLAVYAYLEATPWLAALDPDVRTAEARRYAETVADAVDETLSPNMASLAYAAFVRAEALALEAGDAELVALVDRSRGEVVRRIVAMPDSVRLAFAPAPGSSSAPFSPGLVAFIAFIALGTGAGGVHLWRRRHPADQRTSREEHEASHGFVPYDVRYAGLTAAERCLEALWVLSFSYSEVTEEVLAIVQANCRGLDSQRALFMAAGLMVGGLDYDPLKAAGLVRQRLLRYAKRHNIAYHPGVLLPRDRAEMREWLERQFGVQRPRQVLQAQEPSFA